MPTYKYKIQRLFGRMQDLEKLFELMPVRGFDFIAVRRASDYKEIDRYTGYFQYETGVAEEKTLDYFHSKELEYEEHGLYVFEVVKK